jgi:hypothetical protein
MKKLLWFIRKSKSLFIKQKLHFIVEPMAGFFLSLSYMSKLSKWVDTAEKPRFNDFYGKRYDYNKRYALYKHIIESEKIDRIDYLEFGVSQGHSLRWWVQQNQNRNSRFIGFDTFSGLPEKWGFFKKGTMSAQGEIPKINDARCRFIKGLFQQSLPVFLKAYNSNVRKIIHLDADMYSSTLFVLTMLAPYLKKEDILIFDEFTVPLHEFRAYSDFIQSYYIKTVIIGAVNNYFQIAFKIQENPIYLEKLHGNPIADIFSFFEAALGTKKND